jgi:predicted ribosome quality control (RQC) complex YloA/Tae2 family protein
LSGEPQRFQTIQQQQVYDQTLRIFQDDLQKLQKIEESRRELGQRLYNHQQVLQSLNPSVGGHETY